MKHNNFDALRLSGALMVLVSHMYLLVGLPQPMVMHCTLGKFGLAIFFSISGYLVTESWRRDPDFARFLQRRALRILPGLAVAWATTTAVVASLGLTGFPGNPLHTMNGSLWTIPVECEFYLILCALGVAAGPRLREVMLVVTGVLALHAWQYLQIDSDHARALLELWLFFLGGILMSFYRPTLVVGVGLAALGAWLFLYGYPGIGAALVITPAVVTVGRQSWPVARAAGHYGDLSYGIYVYACPVQQIAVHYLGLDLPATMAASIITTSALAYASWHLIESKALAFKPSKAGVVVGQQARVG